MKAQELIESIKQAEHDTENWYNSRENGVMDIYFDIADAVEEGVLEGVSVSRPYAGNLTIVCEDAKVHVTKGSEELVFEVTPMRFSTYEHMARKPSAYERTRAAVYATGNRWAIANFNATH